MTSLELAEGVVNCKVGDFGMASLIDVNLKGALPKKKKKIKKKKKNFYKKKIFYINKKRLAPEILQGTLYDERSDLFSYGIVCYEIHSRRMPYDEHTQFQVEVDNWVEFGPNGETIQKHGKKNMWKNYGKDAIREIIENDLRPSIPKGLDPEWNKIISGCFSRNPGDRPQFGEISRILTKYYKEKPN